MIDKKEIEHLFKAHYASMYRQALLLLHDGELANDIIHDVFTSLLYSTCDAPLSLSYLISAVRNRCLNHIRNSDIHDRINNGMLMEMDDYDHDEIMDEDTLMEIHTIISTSLSPQCRRIIDLRFYCGLKINEIAEDLNISENAVYKNIRHALLIIRKKLNRHE